MQTILIVDDEKNYLTILSAVLEDEGFEVLTALGGREALELHKTSDLDLILTDMKMPEMDGIELLEHIKSVDSDLPVIMMTAYGTVDKAVEAMQKGAYTYVLKPFDNERLIIYVKKAISMYQVVKENRILRDAVESQYRFGNIIGKSKKMRDIFDTIQKVAPTSATVLIEGESGTGKELVARSIHFNSHRRQKPFVAVNCSALAESLLESELFGHERGAFTGAVATKKGRFELADGGTLFLDEIGNITPEMQTRLLRFLEDRKIRRIGAVRGTTVDCRIIAATNTDLLRDIKEGLFREDLYYRLRVVTLKIPLLRERKEDIPLLSQYFVETFCKSQSVPMVKIPSETMKWLCDYPWPGNVRELKNALQAAVVLCKDGVLRTSDLHHTGLPEIPGIASAESDPFSLEESERNTIIRALKQAGGVQKDAAKLLGISRRAIHYKTKKYEIDSSALRPTNNKSH